MTRAKASGVRNRLFRFAGNRVEIATGVIMALLWQTKAGASEAGFDPLGVVDKLVDARLGG